jgi:hypothetical protein
MMLPLGREPMRVWIAHLVGLLVWAQVASLAGTHFLHHLHKPGVLPCLVGAHVAAVWLAVRVRPHGPRATERLRTT